MNRLRLCQIGAAVGWVIYAAACILEDIRDYHTLRFTLLQLWVAAVPLIILFFVLPLRR